VVQVGCIRRVEGHESRLRCPTTVQSSVQTYRISSVLDGLYSAENLTVCIDQRAIDRSH
jgi:hypothetical protein